MAEAMFVVMLALVTNLNVVAVYIEKRDSLTLSLDHLKGLVTGSGIELCLQNTPNPAS